MIIIIKNGFIYFCIYYLFIYFCESHPHPAHLVQSPPQRGSKFQIPHVIMQPLYIRQSFHIAKPLCAAARIAHAGHHRCTGHRASLMICVTSV